jgi:hypothetical protein
MIFQSYMSVWEFVMFPYELSKNERVLYPSYGGNAR